MTTGKVNSNHITIILDATMASIKRIIPIEHKIGKPQLAKSSLTLEFGVLIGITGDVRGKLILSGEKSLFGSIGQVMFGMPVQDDMLVSFSGELGNMLAGGTSTLIGDQGITTDITAPTIMEGKTNLTGYEKSLLIPVEFDSLGELELYLLLD